MPDKKRPPALSYIGDNSISGIPARDLSPDDLERLAKLPYTKKRLAKSALDLAGVLISTNLYAVQIDEKE